MQTLLHFLGIVAALALSFISSGMETALYRASRVRLRIRADQGDARAGMVLRVLNGLDSMVTTILVDNNIAAYAASYFLTLELVRWRAPHSELITTAVITPVFFVLTESLPKQLAYNRADLFTLALVRVFSAFQAILLPMVWILNRASAGLRRLLGASGETHLAQSQRGLLLEHFNAGVAEKLLSEEQNRMAIRIMQLEGIDAGDIMIPLSRLARIPAGASRRQALTEMSRRRVREALLADGAGKPTGEIVTMNAMIMNPGAPGDPVAALAERPDRIRSEVAIPEVLNLFRNHHARHAIVIQRGRVAGLINTRAVLDRIAGISR